MFVDTHTHLYLPEFENDGHGMRAVERAFDAGIEHLIFPNVDLTTVVPMKELHSLFPEQTSMAMGFHPTEIDQEWKQNLEAVKDELFLNRDEYVAVGEIGIDLYWDKTFAEQQMQALEQQFQWAVQLDKPVIIHCREGLDQTIEVLQVFADLKGVMHSFGGTTADVERVLKTNESIMFGINGIVTFKNSRVRESLPAIGLERLLLETDSPYLAPVPFRGKRCESAMLTHTAAHIASCLGISVDDLGRRTTENARSLFNLSGNGR